PGPALPGTTGSGSEPPHRPQGPGTGRSRWLPSCPGRRPSSRTGVAGGVDSLPRVRGGAARGGAGSVRPALVRRADARGGRGRSGSFPPHNKAALAVGPDHDQQDIGRRFSWMSHGLPPSVGAPSLLPSLINDSLENLTPFPLGLRNGVVEQAITQFL